MKTGGYQIIDLQDEDLRSNIGMQYTDLYEKIEGTRKPILVTGITIDGVEYHNTFAEFVVNGSNYETTIYGKKLVISDLNVVTVEPLESVDDEV